MAVWQWVAFGAVLVLAITILVSQRSIRRQMIAAVNARLPEADQFRPGPSNWRKTRRLIQAYRRLYPEDDLVTRQIRREAMLLVLFVIGCRLLEQPWFVIGCGVAGGLWMGWMLYRREA